MKIAKTLQASAIGLAIASAGGAAHAYSLGDLGLQSGDGFTIQYTNYERINTDALPNQDDFDELGTGWTNTGGVYLGDNYGVASLSGINVGGNQVWADVTAQPDLSAVFWGFDINSSTPVLTNVVAPNPEYTGDPGQDNDPQMDPEFIIVQAVTGFDLTAIGGYIAVYAHDETNFGALTKSCVAPAVCAAGEGVLTQAAVEAGGVAETAGGVDVPDAPGITDASGAELLFIAEFMPGVLLGDLTTTLAGDFNALVGGGDGGADGQASIVADSGSLWEAFDTNTVAGANGEINDLGFESDFGPSEEDDDLQLARNVCTEDLLAAKCSWTSLSNDPVQGAVIPEPTTLALLGAGLLAGGVARRRKKA